MRNSLCLSALFISLFFIACENKQAVQDQDGATNSLSFADPQNYNKNGAPLSISIIIPCENNIVARILLAANNNPKPTIVFLHGNPGFEKNEDIGQALRRNGYNSVFFSYSGTWGNLGQFNYSQSLQDVRDVYEYLINNAESMRIDIEQIYLFGHSMGGDIALLSLEEIKGIKGAITVDSWSGYDVLNSKLDRQRDKYISNLEQRPCINLVSGEAFVNDIMASERMSLENALKNHTKSILNIFSNDREKSTFINYHKEINTDNIVVLDACDHSFSDKRINLTKTIFDYLETHKQ